MQGRYTPLLMVLCIFPLAFDYRSVDENSSPTLQVLLVASALISGILLAMIAPRFRSRSQLRSIVSMALVVTLAGSIVTQLIQGNDIGNYLRVILAFILFFVGYVVGCHPWSDNGLKLFTRCIFVGMVVSMIASFVYGMAAGGSIADVRYRIVSPVLLGFQGLLLHEIVVERKPSKVAMTFFVATLVIELLSVTRSLLAGTLLLFCLATWLAAPTVTHLTNAMLRAFFAAAALGGVVATGATWFLPSVLDHWSQRLFFAEQTRTGKDPTTLSRLAEIQDQYDQVTSSFSSLLIGKGYGHSFHYAHSYVMEMLEFAHRSDLEAIRSWAAGHNFWVYQFFAGGLLFGIALPMSLLYVLYRCIASYRRWRRDMRGAVHLSEMGRYLMVTFAIVATTIGGNPLGPRYSGLIYGLALGLLVSAHSRLREHRRGLKQSGGSQNGARLLRPMGMGPR